MNFKANYEAVNLTSAATHVFLAQAQSGTPIHHIVCLTAGSMAIKALGGGTFTWTATANQTIDVVVGSITVNSGTFVGFKSKWYPTQNVTNFGPY